MKQIILLFLTSALLLSCGGSSNNGVPTKKGLPHDSVQLRMAVMPTLDCLPVYLAADHGFFADRGLDIELLCFRAQMDCDTALERGHANAIVSDLVRTQRMREAGMSLTYITATELHWQLLTKRTARIKELRQLDDKMLAMTRFSATHLLSDKAVDSVGLKPERVFRIQVNDLNVRLGMLGADIMDALLLPEPQATLARNMKARVLMDTRQTGEQLGVVAFTPQAATQKQVDAFTAAYNQACDSLNERGLASYRRLIATRCEVQPSTIDSLPTVHYHHVTPPREQDLRLAEEWLKQKKDNKDVEKQGL